MIAKFDFEKTPVVEVVNEILVDASRRGASDIHFDPLTDYMKVRIRIDGALINYTEVPNGVKKNLITRIKIISGMNITESRLPQDGAIKATLKDVNLDLRVSSIPTSEGEKIVIRILDYSMSLNGLENLGFSAENYKKVLKMITVPNGIILVTGATGSGKSTTVYSILQRLNREETNIITVEDPIEMDVEGINQIQTNSEIGLDFAASLRSILRQDPNIIMVGEIRDTETAKIAVRASITGHLVLSTLHTNDSLNTIERLLDMDVERYLLASSLTGIISQKLARKLCQNCKKTRPANDYEKSLIKKVLKKEVNEVYASEGCEICGNGYHGRIALHEVLVINQEIKDAISSGIAREVLRDLVYKTDVTTLLQDGLEKVVNGLTTFEEVLKLIELEGEDAYGRFDLKTAIDSTIIVNENGNGNGNDEKSVPIPINDEIEAIEI
ncbi:MAG: GspE/PulE family protein [Bacilli bacterium]